MFDSVAVLTVFPDNSAAVHSYTVFFQHHQPIFSPRHCVWLSSKWFFIDPLNYLSKLNSLVFLASLIQTLACPNFLREQLFYLTKFLLTL